MAISFTMVGKLLMPKDTEKFSAYSKQTFSSGWAQETLNLTMLVDGSRFNLKSKNWVNPNKDFTMNYSENVGAGKSERKSILFSKRDSVNLDNVPHFSKYVLDLDIASNRYELENAINTLSRGGSLTDELASKYEGWTLAQFKEAHKKSLALKKSFLYLGDFLDAVKSVISSGKYSQSNFDVRGEYICEYNESNNSFYKYYSPRSISLTNTEPTATANVILTYDENSLIYDPVADKYTVNGFSMERDTRKGVEKNAVIPVPYTITLPKPTSSEDTKTIKTLDVLVKRFTVDDGLIYQYGVVVKLINGSEKVQLNYEDLSEEEQENIDLGLVTLEELRRAAGDVRGERIEENRFFKILRGYAKGRQDTTYSSEDLLPKAIQTTTFDNADVEIEDEDDDLFD